MNIQVHITDGPLGETRPEWEMPIGPGAVLRFDGVARPSENGRPISALIYEAYQPMAERMLRRIAEQVAAKHGLLGLCVEHSTGRVPVGHCSLVVRIAAAHRAEALAAMGEFIDLLKRDVPIWKRAEE
jgi:molybdopterin synthase catalytic subunit